MWEKLQKAISRRDLSRVRELAADDTSVEELLKPANFLAALGEATYLATYGGDFEDSKSAQAMVLLLRLRHKHPCPITDAERAQLGAQLLEVIVAGHREATALLLSAGAEASYRDDEGHTPLGSAVANGDLDAVSLLLLCGADRTINDLGGVEDGAMSPLQMAVNKLDVPMVALLVAAGADPDCMVDMRTPWDYLPDDIESSEPAKMIATLLGRTLVARSPTTA